MPLQCPHLSLCRFGVDVMETLVSWTKDLCLGISHGCIPDNVDDVNSERTEQLDKYLSSWSVLDIGTGNGLLLQELAKQGYAFICLLYLVISLVFV